MSYPDPDTVADALLAMTQPAAAPAPPGAAQEERAAGVAGVSGLSDPSPEVLWSLGVRQSLSGVDVTEFTALSLAAVFACVRNLAEDVAKLPLIVYRSLEPTGKERLPGHPLYRLLHDEPNPEMTAFDFRQSITASAILSGNGYAEIVRAGGVTPVEIWPLEWWRVKPRRAADGRLFFKVDGTRNVVAEDILHVRGFSLNGIVGEMAIQLGRESIGLSMAAERFGAAFFGNGSRPGGYLKFPKALSAEAVKRLKAAHEQSHRGVENAHKTMVLEEGGDFVKDSTDPEEAQFLQTRQFQIEDVARWFRMPPHKIGHLLRATFSNIEHQSIEYVSDTLMPWLVRWEQEIKRKLVARTFERDVFAEHLVDALLRGDALSRSQALEVQARSGALTINEWRSIENRNPLPGEYGDQHFVPLNMTTVERLVDGAEDEPAPGSGDAGGDGAPAGEPAPEPAEPADPPAAPEGGSRAYRLLLADALRRCQRVEVDKIRRAAAKGGDLAEWAKTFYAAHAAHVRAAVAPVAEAFERTAFDVEAYCAAAAAELAAAAADPEPILAAWEADRPERAAAAAAAKGTGTP